MLAAANSPTNSLRASVRLVPERSHGFVRPHWLDAAAPRAGVHSHPGFMSDGRDVDVHPHDRLAKPASARFLIQVTHRRPLRWGFRHMCQQPMRRMVAVSSLTLVSSRTAMSGTV